MSDPVIISKLNDLETLISDPNFSSNYPSEYEYLVNLKKTIKSNYDNNISLSNEITKNIDTLKSKFESKIEKIDNISQRKIEISRFYTLKYKKEISLLQKIVLMCGIGLVGCLLYNIGMISNNMLSFYLGIVLSVGFVVVFYSLWDIYIRDNLVFDEYDYGAYSTKAPNSVTPSNDDDYYKFELANLKC